MMVKLSLVAAWLPLLVAGTAFAQGPVISFDEFGNGAFGPGFLAPDPGPGGLNPVLTYNLPFAGVPGDVFLHDANEPGNPFLDVLRFNGNGTLVFYSDNIDGADAPGDTPAPPGAFYPNQVHIPEVGPEGNNGAIYTPLPGQPGFDPGFLPTYNFVSDGVVPEPSTALLLAWGPALLAIVQRRRRAKK
jgi:hypothetical protein